MVESEQVELTILVQSPDVITLVSLAQLAQLTP